MIEEGRAPVVRSNMAASGEHFATIPTAGGIHLCDLETGEIVEEIYRRATNRFTNATAIAVIDVRHICAHLDNPVLGFVDEAVAGVVVQKIACGIIAVAIHPVIDTAE